MVIVMLFAELAILVRILSSLYLLGNLANCPKLDLLMRLQKPSLALHWTYRALYLLGVADPEREH